MPLTQGSVKPAQVNKLEQIFNLAIDFKKTDDNVIAKQLMNVYFNNKGE